jgi:hypothetical protein
VNQSDFCDLKETACLVSYNAFLIKTQYEIIVSLLYTSLLFSISIVPAFLYTSSKQFTIKWKILKYKKHPLQMGWDGA